MNAKLNKLVVQDIEISLTTIDKEDYICLTDMAKAKSDDARAADIIKNWIRNRATIEFLGVWETIYNPNFKVVEFDHFRKEAGLPTFTMSVSNWVDQTGAIGIFSKSGKNGGTYAHKDIAFEFGAAISPVFKLYIVKEYQRLKQIESNQYGLEWDVKRVLSKVNYVVHTDAVKNYIIPQGIYSKDGYAYASETDLLNLALFGCTAQQWRGANPQQALQGENIRDMASINDLTILSNIESLNSVLISRGVDRQSRFNILRQAVQEQRASLDKVDFIKTLKKDNEGVYVDAQEKQTTTKQIEDKPKKSFWKK